MARLYSDTVYIGVDVSKAKLDVYVPPKQEGLRAVTKELENNIKGLRELRNMAKAANATVCVEPTGGYELELIAFMHKFNVPVAYADALRVRQFAKAEGNLSKNDTIDAALISRLADKIEVRIIEEAPGDSPRDEVCYLKKYGVFGKNGVFWRKPNIPRFSMPRRIGILMASSSRGLSPRVCRTFSDGGSCVEKAVVHDQKGEYPKEPEVIWILGEILRDFPAPEENNALPSENSALDA